MPLWGFHTLHQNREAIDPRWAAGRLLNIEKLHQNILRIWAELNLSVHQNYSHYQFNYKHKYQSCSYNKFMWEVILHHKQLFWRRISTHIFEDRNHETSLCSCCQRHRRAANKTCMSLRNKIQLVWKNIFCQCVHAEIARGSDKKKSYCSKQDPCLLNLVNLKKQMKREGIHFLKNK